MISKPLFASVLSLTNPAKRTALAGAHWHSTLNLCPWDLRPDLSAPKPKHGSFHVLWDYSVMFLSFTKMVNRKEKATINDVHAVTCYLHTVLTDL